VPAVLVLQLSHRYAMIPRVQFGCLALLLSDRLMGIYTVEDHIVLLDSAVCGERHRAKSVGTVEFAS